MSNESRFVGNSIEELLAALADGVRGAQLALNATPLLDASGRPLATYQLPFLDFSIAVEMTTAVSANGKAVATFVAPSANTQTASAVRSHIAGRLVATPPGDGLPVPKLQILASANVGGEARIDIKVANTAGELLARQPIELNIDDAASAQLSAARRPGSFVRSSATRLADALLTTGDDGTARTRLLVGSGQDGRDVIVVVVSIGAFSARAAVSAEVLG